MGGGVHTTRRTHIDQPEAREGVAPFALVRLHREKWLSLAPCTAGSVSTSPRCFQQRVPAAGPDAPVAAIKRAPAVFIRELALIRRWPRITCTSGLFTAAEVGRSLTGSRRCFLGTSFLVDRVRGRPCFMAISSRERRLRDRTVHHVPDNLK